MMEKDILKASVKRSDILYAHFYILRRPSLAVFLSAFAASVAVLIFFDILGHSPSRTDWEFRKTIGTFFFSAISVLLLIYSVAGFKNIINR